MTRKHFEAIAAALNSLSSDPTITATDDSKAAFARTVDAIADVCSSTNDRFNRHRFLTACGRGQNNQHIRWDRNRKADPPRP